MGHQFKDPRERADHELRQVCKSEGIDVDKVLDLYKRIEALIRRGEEADPGLRERVAALSDDPKHRPVLSNIGTWDRLVAKNRHILGVEPAESDMLFMTSYLVMYEALYARVIDALYEVVKAPGQANGGGSLSTGKKADRLAKKGIDIRAEMWPNVRNKAAHMNFAAGHGAFMTNRWGKQERVLISTMDRAEFNVNEAKEIYYPMQVVHMDDVYSAARHAAVSLYMALVHWRHIHEITRACSQSGTDAVAEKYDELELPAKDEGFDDVCSAEKKGGL